jgi:hypothetical protein
MVATTMPLAEAVDADAYIRPYLLDPRFRPIFSRLPWFQISHGGRNVIGPYIPLDNRDMIHRFMGAGATNAQRRGGFVFLQDGQVMGAVLTETILDYMTLLYGRFESRQIFNLFITNQLLMILVENGGTPITPEQIDRRLMLLRPMFADFDRLLRAVNQIANGSIFRFQFVDV